LFVKNIILRFAVRKEQCYAQGIYVVRVNGKEAKIVKK